MIQRLQDFVELLESEATNAKYKPLHLDESSDLVGFILITLIDILLDSYSRKMGWLHAMCRCSLLENDNLSLFEYLHRVIKLKEAKFVSTRFSNENEESLLKHWLLLEMSSKTLHATFCSLLQNRAVLSRYASVATVKTQKQKLLVELKRIDNLSLKIKAKVVQMHLEYQNEISNVNQIITTANSQLICSHIDSQSSQSISGGKISREQSDKLDSPAEYLLAGYKIGNGSPDRLITLDEIRRNIKFLQDQDDDDFSSNRQLQSSISHMINGEPVGIPPAQEIARNSKLFMSRTAEEFKAVEGEIALEKKASLETIYGGESSSNESDSGSVPLLPLRKVEDVMNSSLKSREESLISNPLTKKMKNSQILYKEKFKRDIGMYDFRTEPPANRTAKEQDYRCYSCKLPLGRFALLLNVKKCPLFG